MKKLFLSLALLGFLGCSNDLEENETAQVTNEITMTVKDFKWDTKQSKTTVDISNDGVFFKWAENDTVGIFPNEGAQAYFPMISGAGSNTATFTGGGWALKPSSTYAAYYPFIKRLDFEKDAIPVNYAGQTQVGNASTAHLGKYDFMAAVAETPEQGKVNFNFEHLGCLIKLEIQVPVGFNYNSITLSCDEAVFTTEATIDVTERNPMINSTKGTISKKLSLNLKDIGVYNWGHGFFDDCLEIYFMAAPVNLSNKKVKVDLETDNRTFTGSFIGKNWIAGKAFSQTVILDEIRPTSGLWIDLGLSCEWASHNVGANNPEEYGDYFAFGEISPKDSYSEENYKYSLGYDKDGKWLGEKVLGNISGNSKYDAATANWGSSARMPTPHECEELTRCEFFNTTINGVYGCLVFGPNGNSIFLPAAGTSWGNSSGSDGYYWSSSPIPAAQEDNAYNGIHFNKDVFEWNGYWSCFVGQSIRPVQDKRWFCVK